MTTLFDAGNDDRDDEVYAAVARLEKEGRLPLRYEGCVHVTLPDQLGGAVARLERLRAPYAGARLRLNTVKIHYDGVSEIGTSSVLEPFLSNPRSRGNTLVSGERLRDFMLELDAKGIELHLHTVGDAAVRTALDAVEAAQARLGRPLRGRVTLCHDELVSPADVPRFAKLGVIANFTPHWNGGYFGGADRTLGLARYNRMYSVTPLLDAGATVTFSSDITDHIEWKTGRADPFLGMQIGHNRQEPEGGKDAALRPPENERLRLEDLVKGYTLQRRVPAAHGGEARLDRGRQARRPRGARQEPVRGRPLRDPQPVALGRALRGPRRLGKAAVVGPVCKYDVTVTQRRRRSA